MTKNGGHPSETGPAQVKPVTQSTDKACRHPSLPSRPRMRFRHRSVK